MILLHTQEVTGSSPVAPTTTLIDFKRVVHVAFHRILQSFASTVPELCQNPTLDRVCCAKIHPALVSLAVQFCQRLALHLKLHVRVLLEYLRVALPKQLRHPFVRHAACAEACCVRRTQIVDPKVPNARPPQRKTPNRFERLLMNVWIFIAREQARAWP